MVLKRKLPTDTPLPASAPVAAPQQEHAAPVSAPPITDFGGFDDIPAAPAAKPVASPQYEPAMTAPEAPTSASGGGILKRRTPEPTLAAEPPTPMPTYTPPQAAPQPPVADEAELPWMAGQPTLDAEPQVTTSTLDDGWEVGVEPTPVSYDPPEPEASASVYGDLGRADDPFAVAPAAPVTPQKTEQTQLPPWQRATTGSAPSLPKNPFAGALQGGAQGQKSLITLGVIGLVGIGVFMFVQNREGAVDTVSRWSGTLSSVSQNLPDTAGEIEAMGTPGSDLIEAEEVINAKDVGIAPVQAPTDLAALAAAPQAEEPLQTAESGTAIDFVDVPPAQQAGPIQADGTEQMPEEVSAFAALHEAIMEKRAERDAKRAAQLGTTPENLAAPTDAAPRLQQDVDRELEAYRRVLASIDNPAMKPSPGEFFANPERFDSALQPPSIAAEKPTVTPEGNPIIATNMARAEPEQQVRTLADFEDALLKQPENRVRMPAKVAKPRLGTGVFPPLEILSLIPTYGMLANAGDRQGVLLIGDTFEGWELVGVYDTYAEFQSGERKHIVTLK